MCCHMHFLHHYYARSLPYQRYVVPYGRYNLMETMPLAMMKHLEEDVPPVFMILDTYDKDVKVAISVINL